MKQFNLEQAKAGKPVCTRDGRKARIICFDAKVGIGDNTYIISLVTENDGYDRIYSHGSSGAYMCTSDTQHDLMMADEIETLPNSWEEFCENYPIKDSEFYIGEFSAIKHHESGDRLNLSDCNLLRTYKQAEAMLAFIKLIRLRDVYRQGWEPDWDDATPKYSIRNFSGAIAEETTQTWTNPLSFQSEEIRDTYWMNFHDLIEQAKEFI